jgi:hypothetical protein
VWAVLYPYMVCRTPYTPWAPTQPDGELPALGLVRAVTAANDFSLKAGRVSAWIRTGYRPGAAGRAAAARVPHGRPEGFQHIQALRPPDESRGAAVTPVDVVDATLPAVPPHQRGHWCRRSLWISGLAVSAVRSSALRRALALTAGVLFGSAASASAAIIHVDRDGTAGPCSDSRSRDQAAIGSLRCARSMGATACTGPGATV